MTRVSPPPPTRAILNCDSSSFMIIINAYRMLLKYLLIKQKTIRVLRILHPKFLIHSSTQFISTEKFLGEMEKWHSWKCHRNIVCSFGLSYLCHILADFVFKESMTDSIEHSPSSETDSSSAAQELSRLIWNPSLHYYYRKH